MKINFTVELDKEFSELIQSPIKNFLDRLLPNRIVIKNCDRARRKKIAKLFLFT
jgi:hypothetical protein